MRNRVLSICAVSIFTACGGAGGRGTETNADTLDTLDSHADEVGEANSNAATTEETEDPESSGPGTKFDTLSVPDASGPNCAAANYPEFSYIWVANSLESTLSKINTITMVEEARYLTRSDAAGSPSRTSVNLSGDVAVANRAGGITKVIALHENCDELRNGVPGLQTSTGKNDVLAWGQDDCVAWHTPMPGFNSNRPAAWTSGVFDPKTCKVSDQHFWTSVCDVAQAGSLHVMRLDGDDGTIENNIVMPDVAVGTFGAYGGAVDSNNDFWFITYSNPRWLIKVDGKKLTHESWQVPASVCSYGFAVDSRDRPWIGSFCDGSAVFDPLTEQFTVVTGMLGYGLQEDDEGVMWLATYDPPGIRGIDIESLQETQWIHLPPEAEARGLSVDFHGYVWFVSMTDSAYRVDTVTETWESYDGLNSPYTYSDMTGHGLQVVSGGIPQG